MYLEELGNRYWGHGVIAVALSVLIAAAAAHWLRGGRWSVLFSSLQGWLLVMVIVASWAYESSEPGGGGVVSVNPWGGRDFRSRIPIHFDLPISLCLGLLPLHFFALEAAPGLKRARWLRYRELAVLLLAVVVVAATVILLKGWFWLGLLLMFLGVPLSRWAIVAWAVWRSVSIWRRSPWSTENRLAVLMPAALVAAQALVVLAMDPLAHPGFAVLAACLWLPSAIVARLLTPVERRCAMGLSARH